MLKKSILKIFELKVTGNFSSAHKIRDYKGKCEKLHGHNWKVELIVNSSKLNKSGLVEDFSKLKKILNEELKKLDHKYLNNIKPFDKINPTCENIAKYLFDTLNSQLSTLNSQLFKVTVWENETQCASYGFAEYE